MIWDHKPAGRFPHTLCLAVRRWFRPYCANDPDVSCGHYLAKPCHDNARNRAHGPVTSYELPNERKAMMRRASWVKRDWFERLWAGKGSRRKKTCKGQPGTRESGTEAMASGRERNATDLCGCIRPFTRYLKDTNYCRTGWPTWEGMRGVSRGKGHWVFEGRSSATPSVVCAAFCFGDRPASHQSAASSNGARCHGRWMTPTSTPALRRTIATTPIEQIWRMSPHEAFMCAPAAEATCTGASKQGVSPLHGSLGVGFPLLCSGRFARIGVGGRLLRRLNLDTLHRGRRPLLKLCLLLRCEQPFVHA